MKKSLVLLFSLLVISYCITLNLSARANPYIDHKSVDNPAFVEPPVITISSPKQYSVYSNVDSIALSFNVTGPEAPNLLTKYLTMVDYQGDWMQEPQHVYRSKNFEVYTPGDFPYFLDFNLALTNIPFGRHSIVITAFGAGGYAQGLTWFQFNKNSVLAVNFTVEKTPQVKLLLFENTSFTNSSIPLDFTVDQPDAKVSYSLDGGEPVIIAGNATLDNVPNGYHNITVSAIAMNLEILAGQKWFNSWLTALPHLKDFSFLL